MNAAQIRRRATVRLTLAASLVAVACTLAPLPWPESWWRQPPATVPSTTSMPVTP